MNIINIINNLTNNLDNIYEVPQTTLSKISSEEWVQILSGNSGRITTEHCQHINFRHMTTHDLVTIFRARKLVRLTDLERRQAREVLVKLEDDYTTVLHSTSTRVKVKR